MSTGNNRNDTIQGLRGIAALLVVVDHSIFTLHERTTYDAGAEALASATGELGVKMFFIVSGFIMTITMYKSFGVPGAPLRFMNRRLIRIAPLYWLATLVFVTKLIAVGKPPRLDELIMSLLFIPYDHGQSALRAPVYGLGWTLDFEILFYSVFALSLLLRRSVGLPLLAAGFGLLVLAGYAEPVRHCSGALCDILRYYANPIILYFVTGAVLALVRLWIEAHRRLPAITMQTATAVTLGAATIYAMIVVFGHAQLYTPLFRYSQLAVCLLSATTCALAMTSAGPGQISALLLMLGDASYSIYLTHSFVIGPASRIWMHLSLPANELVFTAVMVVCSCAVGVPIYRYLEQPLLRFLSQRSGRPAVAVS